MGSYEIGAPLGAGGMGEVYRARDTKLNRVVAIKALPDAVSSQPDRIARFEREAHLLASINHPNIAAIYGVEVREGSLFLVLEFVEGRPLSEMLTGGPLPVSEVLTLAAQIADALAAAHERGIIHRDLKPGNVMVTADDKVKVLDFGLGKALDRESSASSTDSPTMTLAATQQGIVLGTAGYMSPEQAKGRAADKRSDVWAFGTVIYEMLTGKRAFAGEDVTDTLAAIVRGDPDWAALPKDLPAPVRTLLERCLVKNRTERLPDMSVVRFLLSEGATGQDASPEPGRTPPPSRVRFGMLAVAAGIVVVAAGLTAIAARWLSPDPGSAARVPVHASLEVPDGDVIADTDYTPLAISPDGSRVAYVGERDGRRQLFLRELSSGSVAPLGGTDGARSPFFSPNGQWIGFFAQGKVKKIATNGAGVQALTDASDARGGAWAAEGTIYFAPTNLSEIFKVSDSGGPATALTRLDRSRGEISHRWPQVLPDGRTLLFTAWTGPGPDERELATQPIEGGEHQVVLRGGDSGRYVANQLLVYGRLDALLAVPWQPSQGPVGGTAPVMLNEHVRLGNEGAADYGVSSDGTLVYVEGGDARYVQRLVWIDRRGTIEALPVPERDYEAVAISPNGQTAVTQIREGTMGLWLYDFSRHSLTPFATSGGSSQGAAWTPDGKRIIYRGTRHGTRNLYWKPVDGSGDEERLTTKEGTLQTPGSVSPDGQWLLFLEGGAGNGSLWIMRLNGDRTPRPFHDKNGAETSPVISPDGKWVAYVSDASGRPEVYVQAFSGSGPRVPVSVQGGVDPRWSRDGHELFFASGDRQMAVAVSSTPAFSAGAPVLLYEGRFRASPNGVTAFDVASTGRFLRIQQTQPDRPVTGLELVLNWFTELRRPPGSK